MQLPKIVAARLQGSVVPEHPDPDLLTAFAESTLLGKEREQVLSHLGTCAECRQILALATPELATQINPAARREKKWSWWQAPVLRWGALAACVLVVATVVLMHEGNQSSRTENTQIAMQKGPAPMLPAAPTRPEMKEPARNQTSPARTQSSRSVAAGMKRVPAPAAGAVPMSGFNASASADANAVNTTPKSETVETQAEALVPQAPAGGQLRARNSMSLAKAAPVFTPRPSTDTAASTIGGAAKLTDLRPPTWRLSDDGLPERSFTSGQWEKVQVDHKNGFRALAAQGMEVWVGGAAGLLYHSEDMGLNWRRLIPVAGSSTLTDDITRIELADHLHGKVMTSAGQTWVTSDAGKTWETQ